MRALRLAHRDLPVPVMARAGGRRLQIVRRAMPGTVVLVLAFAGIAAAVTSTSSRTVPGSAPPAQSPFMYSARVVAAGDDGTIAVAFTRTSLTSGQREKPGDAFTRVTVAVRRPDGRWHRTRTVSSVHEYAVAPRVVVDAHGRVLVVWIRRGCMQGPNSCAVPFGAVRARWMSADGRWGPIETIGGNSAYVPTSTEVGYFGENNGQSPVLAVDDRGSAIIIWNGVRTSASYRRPGGRFGPPSRLPQSFGQLAVAMGRGGRVVVAGIRGYGRSEAHLKTTVRGPDGRWSAAQRISAPPASSPRIAIASDGAVIVAWSGTPIDDDHTEFGPVKAAIGTPEGRFSATHYTGGQRVTRVHLAAGGAGETILAWGNPDIGFSSPDSGLNYAIRQSGGAFGPPQAAPSPDAPGIQIYDQTIGMLRGGLGLWFSEENGALRLSTRPVGGSFGEPRVLAPSSRFMTMASSPAIAAVVGTTAPALAGISDRSLQIVTVRP